MSVPFNSRKDQRCDASWFGQILDCASGYSAGISVADLRLHPTDNVGLQEAAVANPSVRDRAADHRIELTRSPRT